MPQVVSHAKQERTFLRRTNSCVACTVAGYYQNPTTQQCTACDSSCQTCNGSNATSCLSCKAGTYLLASNNSCVACTAAGYYQNTTNQQCGTCDSSCQTCSGSNATSCLSCKTGMYLLASNNSCVSCNVAGYYQNTTSQQCTACDSSCQTCNGSNATSCLSCKTGKYLLASNNSCVTCTVVGYYQNTTTQQCTACDSSCLTCNGSNTTSCLSCKTRSIPPSIEQQLGDLHMLLATTKTYPSSNAVPATQAAKPAAALIPQAVSHAKQEHTFLPRTNSCVACTVVGYYQNTTNQQCTACDSKLPNL